MTVRAVPFLLALTAALAATPPAHPSADDSPLALSDLAGYRKALIEAGPATPPLAVSYRALWDHPERYEGKRVRVEGRIVRRFRQGALGTFPPLVEAWAVTPAGEPYCWVFPEPKGAIPSASKPSRFVGTFLKRIRYEGADVPRLAPLIVGPAPPVDVAPSQAPSEPPRQAFSWVDWSLGAGAALVVAAVLAWQHARKPIPRTPPLEMGPAPTFEASPQGDVRDLDGRQETSQDEAE